MLRKSSLALGFFILSTLSATSLASEVATSKAAFCNEIKSNKARHQELLMATDDMRMSFSNHGGLINGGVCWWHSRFQRNAAYLTIYRPDLPRPTREQAKDIIKDIRFARGVVTIPGYENFYDFSRDFYDEIQSRLEGWQRTDGFIMQQWVVGLAGASETSPENLKKKMDELYDQVSQGDVVYQKLQIKGIVAHAWLVVGMEKTENGYEVAVIDSNSPVRTQTYTYTEGDTSFYHYYYGNFVPYTGKNRELRKLKRKVKSFCR
jgi:hypothetical protein